MCEVMVFIRFLKYSDPNGSTSNYTLKISEFYLM